MRGLSLVAASEGHSSSRCAGLPLSRPLLLRSTGSRRAGSVIVAHGPSCSAACGIFPDQGSNPCPLHWQADSQPLRHQGSPLIYYLIQLFIHQTLIEHLLLVCIRQCWSWRNKEKHGMVIHSCCISVLCSDIYILLYYLISNYVGL